VITSTSVVLDACVLVPYYVRDALLTVAHYELYRPKWTNQILEEVRRTRIEKLGHDPRDVQRTLDRMNAAFTGALIDGFEDLIPVMRNDDGDRHVLAAAVAQGAKIIVTANLRHFSETAIANYDIRIMHPDDFLLMLLDMTPDETLASIRHIIQRLRNPNLTTMDFSQRLGTNCPKFAAAILSALEDAMPIVREDMA
jgi:predicted nucleic acid-binding protein